MAQSFGTRIKALRTEKKLTLDQLAQASGSSKGYIWELENKNPPRPSAEKLSAIAKALGVTTDYLLGNDETRETAEEQAFFRQYQGMSPDTRKQLREFADFLGKQGLK